MEKELSPEQRVKNAMVLETYEAKWQGPNAVKTRQLFTKAVKGMDKDQACSLQDHVLAVLGHCEAEMLASDSFSADAAAWVEWMVK